ncbi:hypothetical protein NO1_0361 [Candidatus Termititenax aidoneus]|uniref:Uncharacterized protein n=1 Tax=Termititenax aidoneus TaxID=2218524 RepID=A0A388T9M1_TERA1|nr:hypothetical protein NO1_0361 [Candidatus Termititenax aidoneus]
MADVVLNNDGYLSSREYELLLRRQKLPSADKNDAGNIKELTGGLNYDDFIQSIFDEAKNLDLTKKRESLTNLKEICGNSMESNSRYNADQRISLYYALISWTMQSGDYTQAKKLLHNLNPDLKKLEEFNSDVFNTEANTYNPPLTLLKNLTIGVDSYSDKQMWFVSMLIELAEKGQIASLNDDLIKILNSLIRDATGDLKTFFQNAKEYLRLKIQVDYVAADWRNLYAKTIVVRDKQDTLDFLNKFLRVKVLTEIMTNDPDPNRYFTETENINLGDWKNRLSNEAPKAISNAQERIRILIDYYWETIGNLNSNQAREMRDTLVRERDKSLDNLALWQQISGVLTQYFILLAETYKTQGNYTALATHLDWAESKIFQPLEKDKDRRVKSLRDKEGHYMAKFIDFARVDAALLRAKAAPTDQNIPAVLTQVQTLEGQYQSTLLPADRQRLHYARADYYQLCIKQAEKAGNKTLANSYRNEQLERLTGTVLTINESVNNVSAVLNTSYRKNTQSLLGEDKKFFLNALCEAAELHTGLKNKATAEKYYNVILRQSSELAGLLNSYANKTAFSELESRFLILAAQFIVPSKNARPILEKITAVCPPNSDAYIGAQKMLEAYKFVDLLDRLEICKKTGEWQKGLADIDEAYQKKIFNVPDNADDDRARKEELVFQIAEFQELRAAADRTYSPAVWIGDLPAKINDTLGNTTLNDIGIDNTPPNQQRRMYLELSALSRRKDYAGILRLLNKFFVNDVNSKISLRGLDNIGTPSVNYLIDGNNNKNENETPEEQNARFRDNLACAYLEALNTLRTSEQTVPANVFAPSDLAAAFSSRFSTTRLFGVNGQDGILHKKDETGQTADWTDTERRIMFLAAQCLKNWPKDISQKEVYEEIIRRYPLPSPLGYTPVNGVLQTYYYNSDAKRAYWEAQAGLVNYYAKQKNFDEQKTVFAKIEAEYKNRVNPQSVTSYAADAAYIKNLYFNALLMQCLSDLEQENRAAALKNLQTWKTLRNDVDIYKQLTDADRERHTYTLVEMLTRAAMLLDTQEDRPQAALDELLGIYRNEEYNLSRPQTAAAKLCADIIRGNVAALVAANKEKTIARQRLVWPEGPDGISRDYFTTGLADNNYEKLEDNYKELTHSYEKRLFISFLLNQAKLGDQQAFKLLQALLDREQTKEDVGEDFFKQIEQRFELDTAWNSLDAEYRGYQPENIDAESIAKKYLASSYSANTRDEAEDLLRLAWSKGADPQKAILDDGQTRGYAALIVEPIDFADKRVRGALDNLISLYAYKPQTRDAEQNKGKLDALVKSLQAAYDRASNDLRGKELYVKALLAQAETYYRRKNMTEKEKVLEIEKALDIVKSLLAEEISIPEKTAQYYVYCEQRIRLSLRQAQDSNKTPLEIDRALETLRQEFNLISPDDFPTNLTEKLLNSFITINKPGLTDKEIAAVLTDLGKNFEDCFKDFGEDPKKDIEACREFFENICQTNYQRRLFISILCSLANETSAALDPDTESERAALIQHGDNDVYEQAVEALLLDSEYLPTALALELLGSEFAETIKPRLRLNMAWRGLTGENKESVDHVISPDWLTVAAEVVEDIDILTAANPTLKAELQDEVNSLRYFVLIKSKDTENINTALQDYYLPRIANGIADADEKTLVIGAYAYDLRDYTAALSYIDKNIQYTDERDIQSDTALDPILFSIVVDCWSKQEPKKDIPEAMVQQYIKAIQTRPELYANDKAKTALANIVCAYVAQQLENGKADAAGWLDSILTDLEHSSLTRSYIENRIKTLQAKARIIQNKYTEASKLLHEVLEKFTKPAELEAYKDKLEPQPFAYIHNDALRQLAQVKEAQGDYKTALDFLDKLPETEEKYPGDDPKEKTRAWLYDRLQSAGILMKQGKYPEAETKLQTVREQNTQFTTADDRGLVYFKLLDLALAEARQAETRPGSELRSAAEGWLADLDALGLRRPENIFLREIQRAACRKLLSSAAPETLYTAAKKALAAVPAGPKREAYADLLDELQAYADLESRSYLRPDSGTSIAPAELPEYFEPADGLAAEEHALTLRTIYLNSLLTAGDTAVLTKINDDLSRLETELAKTDSAADSEGLRLALQKYRAELNLLKYSFLKTHFQYDKDGREITERWPEEKVRGSWSELPPVFAVDFEKRFADLLQTSGSDTPPYNILEEKTSERLADFDQAEDDASAKLEFWEYKKKIDDLLNDLVALGGSSLAGAPELAQAVCALYGFDPALAEAEIIANGQEPRGGILAIVRAFRAQFKPQFDAGLDFTAEEKGYGYYLLSRLLIKEEKDVSRLLEILVDGHYLDGKSGGYYAESGALLIDFWNKQIKRNSENKLPQAEWNAVLWDLSVRKKQSGSDFLPDIEYTPRGGNIVSNYGEMSLTKNLEKKIKIAERETALDLPSGFAEWKEKYKDRLTMALTGKYQYTAGKMLLDYIGVLIRRRAEEQFVPKLGELQQKIELLFDFVDDFINALPPDELAAGTYYYYQLRTAVLKTQYSLAALPDGDQTNVWSGYKTALTQNLNEVRTLLLDRKDVLDAAAVQNAESALLQYLLTVWDQPAAAEIDSSQLPEEAYYLYVDLFYRFIEALLIQYGKLNKTEKNHLDTAISVFGSILQEEHTGLPYLKNNLGNAASRLTIGLRYLFDWIESGSKSTWDTITTNPGAADGGQKNEGNTSDSSSTMQIHTLELPLSYTPLDWLTLRATAGVSFFNTDFNESMTRFERREGMPQPYPDNGGRPPLNLEEFKFSKFGLGVDLATPTLGWWTGSYSADVWWNQTPQLRSPIAAQRYGEDVFWNQQLGISAFVGNKFNLVPNSLTFDIDEAASFNQTARIEAVEDYRGYRETRVLDSVFQNRLTGRLNFSFGQGWSAYAGGGWLFENAQDRRSLWEGNIRNGWLGELGLSYYGESLTWGLDLNASMLGRALNAGLGLRLEPFSWRGVSLLAGVSYGYYPEVTLSRQNTILNNGMPTVTKTTETQSAQKNWKGFLGFNWNIGGGRKN